MFQQNALPLRLRQRLCSWLMASGAVMGMGLVAVAPTAHANAAVAAADAGHVATLRQAHQWLESGQAQTAYTLLEPLEAELAGNIEYDWLFGQAALHADEPSRAAFAFERCLAVDPANGLCRLGIARAHISLQEVNSAQDELDILSQSSPPEPVQKAIANYMDILAGTEAANQDTRLTSYVQVGVGYDSNINSATGRSSMALPGLWNLVFRLSDDGQKKDSAFNEARFNISYSTPIAPNWRFLTEANVAFTGNWETSDYNTLVSDLSVGLARRANKHQFVARVQGQNYRLGDHTYRNLVGVLGQYSYSVSRDAEINIFAQGNRLHYPGNTLRNANRFTLGGSWSQGLARDRAVAYLSAYGGTEDTIKSRAPKSFDYSFTGLRAGGMYLLSPRLQVEAGGGVEKRRYDGKDWLFDKSRRDTYYDAYLGFNYAINRKTSLRPQYRYAHNDSNATLYSYRRHVVTMNLRYELF